MYAIDRNKKSLKTALKENSIDRYFTKPLAECFDVDLIIFALPIYTIRKVFKTVSKYIRPYTLITDVASTKLELEKFFIAQGINYIGSHPVAGAEKSGYRYSKYEILQNRVCLITSNPISRQYTGVLKRFWKRLGMRVKTVTAEKHDRIMAFTSHFVHILTFVYMDLLKHQKLSDIKYFIGPSFEDFTRVADNNPDVWSDILLDNKKELIKLYKSFFNIFDEFMEILINCNRRKILKTLKNIRNYKRKI